MSSQPNVTVGIDLGDRHSHLCLLGTASGEEYEPLYNANRYGGRAA